MEIKLRDDSDWNGKEKRFLSSEQLTTKELKDLKGTKVEKTNG